MSAVPAMIAQMIHDSVPLGSLIEYSDGTPRPPERHRKKLAAWKHANSSGRLVRKQPGQRIGDRAWPASFTLDTGDIGSGGVVLVRVRDVFSVDTQHTTFTVTERPAIGAIRVLDRLGDRAELLHLAEDRMAAETWLVGQGYMQAVLDEVTASEAVVSGLSVGRAA